ncbi:FO synthase subunit 1 /FO synthase subunit 2 [Sphingobium faniae]|nr:FO synthase subunit 1 /FO synthase subunit 2 [Sphingobium faniae]
MSVTVRSTMQPDEQTSLMDAPIKELVARATALRDQGFGQIITYSRKVFLPLTQLCRDTCHYCTFAKAPRRIAHPFMSVEEVLKVVREGAELGCKEALFTLGERPELRYRVAREWLDAAGFESTLHYVAHVAALVRDETGLLPHINAGCMTADEVAMLRPVSASMGLMLESISERLCQKGGPHYGSPDKAPAMRLESIAEAGRHNVPFTTGILIGIGETRQERVDALLAIKALHERYGHIQEVIVQNFVPKGDTRMAHVPAADAEELVWTIAMARILLGADMSIQAPPNLNMASLRNVVDAGINDWGGVSPLTPDFVNPECPWPQIDRLRDQTEAAGKTLAERLTIYPAYSVEAGRWIDPAMRRPVQELSDTSGLGREDHWRAGRTAELPQGFALTHRDLPGKTRIAQLVEDILDHGAEQLGEAEIASLFEARGADFHRVCEAADYVRAEVNGDVATYVVNRNINYTNICNYRCNFCAFSKGTRKHEGAEKPYLLDVEEIAGRAREARERGGTEVCLQGGIHPKFTGQTYIDILRAVKSVDPAMHVHAFSPLEVFHGASTLGMNLVDYLSLLRDEGLGSLPGTAAEILHDPIRDIICPDKLNSHQWLEVIEAAHEVGLRTTATIMFGHVDRYRDWAIHLRRLRDLQKRTGGFTEFVPLAFVAHEAPVYKRGQARPGPTLREAVLMHAVGRLALYPYFENVQASWVKMGREGMREALRAGANDMGGTLMNESITRAAGATHGQEWTADDLKDMAKSLGRVPVRRTTLYGRFDNFGREEREREVVPIF